MGASKGYSPNNEVQSPHHTLKRIQRGWSGYGKGARERGHSHQGSRPYNSDHMPNCHSWQNHHNNNNNHSQAIKCREKDGHNTEGKITSQGGLHLLYTGRDRKEKRARNEHSHCHNNGNRNSRTRNKDPWQEPKIQHKTTKTTKRLWV